MGNCYGEDRDSEDEYYGYYSKNNRLKPQPDPAPPQPDPPAHMSYHYNYEHDDGNGNTTEYGNDVDCNYERGAKNVETNEYKPGGLDYRHEESQETMYKAEGDGYEAEREGYEVEEEGYDSEEGEEGMYKHREWVH
jgi:hypothetical protein